MAVTVPVLNRDPMVREVTVWWIDPDVESIKRFRRIHRRSEMGQRNDIGSAETTVETSRSSAEGAWNRRSFLKAGVLGAASVVLPRGLSAASPLRLPGTRRSTPVRIRGRVGTAEKGIGGVAISDGFDVTLTDEDGSFELVTTQERDFLRLSVPAGYRIPRSPGGPPEFYRPIRSGRGGEMEATFDLQPLEVSDLDHTVLLLADIQTEDQLEMGLFSRETIPDLQATLRELGSREVLGLACGDIMFDHLELFGRYQEEVAGTGVPFFQILGNHDMDQGSPTDRGSTATFSRHFGPAYYSFDRGAVHYVVLDDVFWHGDDYIGYLTFDQLRWLENDLRHVEPGRPVIVAGHIPFQGSRHLRVGEESPGTGMAVTNREALFRLLEPYGAHLLAGHTHESEHLFHGRIHEHVNGAVCGAWWSGPICGDGTPCGYSVYSVRGEEVSWRYKSTGYGFDHQMRVYGHGADPSAPDEIVANIWDWDPRWRVVWYEDGERKGEMARRVSTDPLSEVLHRGDDLPARRSWVDPLPVGHLFFAPASRDAREIRVEATDRFGRRYSAVAEPPPERGSHP
jgi:hypothetical protein